MARESAVWFRFRGWRRRRWTVALAEREFLQAAWRLSKPEDEDYVCGMTNRSLRLILVDAGLVTPAREETLLHEMMHASLSDISSDAEFAARGIHCTDAAADTEEHMISVLSPRLYSIIRRSHWRPPPLPPAARSLVRRCRRNRKDDE